MNEFNEVTADNLSRVRGAKGLNQEEVADVLGIAQTSVSKIENGTRALSPSEKAILDWHFFGIVPASVTAKLDLQGVLEFTDDEWHIISLMAKRAGQTPDQWIRESILSFMALRDPTTAAGKADGTHGKTSS
jgi:transcriptional regulator with XRE-family HTH domain